MDQGSDRADSPKASFAERTQDDIGRGLRKVLSQDQTEAFTSASVSAEEIQKRASGDLTEVIVLPHSHAHAQWRTIAEEFSSLLDKDFVDVLFKVRGNIFLGAHRALLAAVWPVLRPDLKKIHTTPKPELLESGLVWVSGVAAPPAFEGALSPSDRKESEEGEKRRQDPEEPGVLDVSNRSWGSWSIVRALFCHLYSRPVAIQYGELPDLRTAAANLGCLELVRCCDAAIEKRRPRERQAQAAPKEADNPSVYRAISSTSGISRDSNEQIIDNEKKLATGHLTPEKRPPQSKASEEKGDQKQRNEARARVVPKPKGESSFTHTQEVREEFGIRHVLSDLKRSIAEASRVISDKSFQSVYDMVPGERGILGEGINGPVRMATSKRTGREVAVKRISCVNMTEQRRQMLLSEVRIFLQVSHRNIIQLFEVYESEADQAVLLIMELCTGKELFERLAAAKYYSEFDAARVTRQMLDAVSYLHSQNICHRDLKLENWLYENPSSDAKLKLCDFGFGQIVEPTVQLTATLGSLYYVAPEVLEGSYGLPCDMWSMGVIVYMLLSGNPPFDGKTDGEVIQKIKLGRFGAYGKKWEGISETAKHFLHSVLRKDPYERLSASEAAQHAWLNMETASKRLPPGVPCTDRPIEQTVIRDMWKFAKNNAIARAALGMLSTSSKSSSFHGVEEDVVSLEQRFKRFDGQNTGKIDAEEFINVLRESLQISSSESARVIDMISGILPDAVNSGDQKTSKKREINYSEFITLTKAKRVANNSAAIREAFRAFDKDGEGFITDDEIRGILGEEFKKDEETMVATLEKCDLNGEGLIDYVDFAKVFTEQLSKKAHTAEEGGVAEASTPIAAKEVTAAKIEERQGDSASTPPGVPAVKKDDEALSASHTSGASGGLQPSPRSVSPSKGGAAGQDDDEEEEKQNDDEHWPESDGEEQLVSVSVKEEGKRVSLEPSKQQQEKEVPVSKEKKDPKFHSFSLSLAGSSEHDDVSHGGINRVVSMPSDFYHIRQMPGFHKEILKPFYGARPVSNVILGLIRGTSLYAKQSVVAKLATIIHTICGWYFLMPNPKYHKEVNDRKGLLSKETGKFRFVAWWIHPRFVPQLRRWFERMSYEGIEQDSQQRATRARERAKAEKTEKLGNEATGDDSLERKQDLETDPEMVGMDANTMKHDRVEGNLISQLDGRPASPTPAQIKEEIQERAAQDSAGVGSPIDATLDESKKASSDEKNSDKARASKREPVPVPPGPAERGQSGSAAAANVDVGAGKDYPMGMGSPGDFQFSDVPKPESYLHTYRDLHTREHIVMLNQLYEGVNRFMRTLFDENFLTSAQISAGFHYPVRTQYATLHMQVRVNSGSVCRDDGRGIDIHSLIENLQGDRLRYYRDDEPLRYQVTENIKVSLLAAANEYAEIHPEMEVVRQTGALGYDLGFVSMPTIRDDEGDEEDGNGNDEAAEVLGEYIINLQPQANTPFADYLYQKRQELAEKFGKDPSYLYPLHVSVTGFFEAKKRDINQLLVVIHEVLAEELSELKGREAVKAGEVLSVNAGYVLQDLTAAAITRFAKALSLRAKDFGVNIRSKAVNHISLAMGRPDVEMRREIQDLYAADPERLKDSATFELVLARRIKRGSFETMDVDGPHQFREVARIPVSTPPGPGSPMLGPLASPTQSRPDGSTVPLEAWPEAPMLSPPSPAKAPPL